MTPEASRHRRRIGGLLAAGKLPWDYTPEPTPMELPLCVLCRRPNPNPASSACPTCIPPDEGEVRLQGRVAALEAELAVVSGERDKLQAFKDWVHAYLNGKGVPHHPPGVHGAEGCRIGDRMDWVWATMSSDMNRIVSGFRSHLGDLIRRIGPARRPDDIKAALEDIHNAYNVWADKSAEAECDRLREALCWAVGFIRCNFPKASEQYEDMRNAESLAEAHPLHTGEFQRASARAELAEAERDRTASELHAVHAACMEHVRIRNEMGEEAAELRQALTRLACFAATAKHANTFEWMLDLVEHLNRTAVTLNEPTQFTHRKNQATGEMWITAETIP